MSRLSLSRLGPGLSVALDFEISGVLDPVNYNLIMYNHNNRYSNGFYTVPTTGPYFFHTSVAAKVAQSVNYGMYNSFSSVFHHILRTDRTHNGVDSIARDVLLPFTAGDVLKVSSIDPNGIYSDGERQTSWSGFSLNDAMRDVIAFSVSNAAPHLGSGVIPFPDVALDIGNGFIPSSNRFRAPTSGTYYLSWTTGAQALNGQRSQLQTSLQGRICELWREGTSHLGVDILNRAPCCSSAPARRYGYRISRVTCSARPRREPSPSLASCTDREPLL